MRNSFLLAAMFSLFGILIRNEKDISLSIDIPKNIQAEDTVMLTANIGNNSGKTISFWKFKTYESLLNDIQHWDIIISKGEDKYALSSYFICDRGYFPPVIKLKSSKEQYYELPLLFNKMRKSDEIEPNPKSGEYEIQLEITLKKPKSTIVKSNKVKFYLNAN